MAFDGRGRRIIKVAVQQSGNNRMYTIYAGTKIVSEFTDASTATYNSGTTPGQAPSDTVSTLLYQHQDQLTTREVTDNFANVAYQRGDFPYGDQWYDTGTASLSVMRKYTSYQMEPELSGSLNYAMAREHSARLGRFHTPDPHPPARNRDPQRLNRYSYVGGDPINHEDPTGRFIAGVAAGCVEDSLDGWDGFLLGPTGGPTPDDINCAAILLLPPPPPPPAPVCTFDPKPLGISSCNYNGRGGNLNSIDFTALTASESPTLAQCGYNPDKSTCSAKGSPNVDVTEYSCNMQIVPSGTAKFYAYKPGGPIHFHFTLAFIRGQDVYDLDWTAQVSCTGK